MTACLRSHTSSTSHQHSNGGKYPNNPCRFSSPAGPSRCGDNSCSYISVRSGCESSVLRWRPRFQLSKPETNATIIQPEGEDDNDSALGVVRTRELYSGFMLLTLSTNTRAPLGATLRPWPLASLTSARKMVGHTMRIKQAVSLVNVAFRRGILILCLAYFLPNDEVCDGKGLLLA